MIEDIELPYEYADNTRAGTITFVVICVALSIAMIGIHFGGLFVLPWFVMLAPAALVFVRALLFTCIRNGVHEALRDAATDARLDDHIIKAAGEIEKRTLTSTAFAARLAGEEEIA